MKVRTGSYWDKNSYYVEFGITFWLHRHSSVCPWHFDLIIDFLVWYIEFTFGKEDSEEKG